jgi:hypothetical protein
MQAISSDQSRAETQSSICRGAQHRKSEGRGDVFGSIVFLDVAVAIDVAVERARDAKPPKGSIGR